MLHAAPYAGGLKGLGVPSPATARCSYSLGEGPENPIHLGFSHLVSVLSPLVL